MANTAQTFNVWDTQKFFQENNSLPPMSDEDKKTFHQFLDHQVTDLIEAYERYTYNHGGLRDEAKSILKQIEEAEQQLKKFKEIITPKRFCPDCKLLEDEHDMCPCAYRRQQQADAQAELDEAEWN